MGYGDEGTEYASCARRGGQTDSEVGGRGREYLGVGLDTAGGAVERRGRRARAMTWRGAAKRESVWESVSKKERRGARATRTSLAAGRMEGMVVVEGEGHVSAAEGNFFHAIT